MDIAYDHIQEEALTPEQAAQKSRDAEAARQSNLNTELQETYKSLAATSWGQSLGGFFSDVKKQSETFIDEAKQEAGVMQGEAFRGFTGLKDSLVGHARSMSGTAAASGSAGPIGDEEGKASGDETEKDRKQSEALRESEGMISKFRAEATKRLKELEKAEEAADAAIFRFGANIGNFLKEAVTVASPETTESQGSGGKVLFESRDVDGKRVIHSTRFEAQLHAVHSSLESFTKDPESTEYAAWKDSFNIDSKTAAIAKDLEKYLELRASMEKLVPEKVEYPVFWTRYYFLRMVVETEEERRREILKGAAKTASDETIAWDDDSDDDDDEQSSTPRKQQQQQQQQPVGIKLEDQTQDTPESSTTLHPRDTTHTTTSAASSSNDNNNSLKPTADSRRSEDGKSQADSDASYDLVSGATSRAPGSPKEGRAKKEAGAEAEEEEEEDWE